MVSPNRLLVAIIIVVLVPVNCFYKTYYCSPGDDDPKDASELNVSETCANTSINETGLCFRCRSECGPAILSESVVCVDCRDSHGQWMGIIALNFFLLTLLFFACVLLRINVAACPLNVIVYFYQITTVLLEIWYTEDIMKKRHADLKILATIYGFFNLNFFRYVIPPQCIDIDYINVLYFEYIVAAFPFLLCFIAFLLIKLYDKDVRCIVRAWRPFSKCFKGDKWNPRVTIINTYITFFLLSQAKVIFTTFKILYLIKINNDTYIRFIPSFDFANHDGNLSYYSLLTISLAIVFVFVLTPVLLQVVYPTRVFRKCLNKCHCLRQDILNILMDAFQGYYKDGTNGSHDYRYMSVVFVVLRLCLLPIAFVGFASNYQLADTITHVVISFIHGAIGVFYFTAKPYKHSWMNEVDGTILVLLGMTILANTSPAVYKSVSAAVWIPVIPLLCGLLYLPYYLHVSCKKHKVVKRSRKWLTLKVKSHTRHTSRNQAIINADQEPTETDMTSSISADRELHPRQYEESIYGRSQHNAAASASQADRKQGGESPLVPLLHRDSTGVVSQSMTIVNTGCVNNDYGTTNRYTRLYSDPYEI